MSPRYSQTCLKQSPRAPKISGRIRQMVEILLIGNVLQRDKNRDWPHNTDDRLRQVTVRTDLTVCVGILVFHKGMSRVLGIPHVLVGYYMYQHP
jgi:hypothetical protein